MTNESSSLPVGVLGANGYTGRELVRWLARHPRARIGFATSESEAGRLLTDLVRGAPDLRLVRADDAPLGEVEVVFSCLPHGASLERVETLRSAGLRVIDLSNDLRVPGPDTPAWAEGAVYGLPELHRERIARAELIANPGCYPTAAILALAPLLREDLVASGPVIVNAASGVTGAGRTPKRELLYAEVAEDFRAYALGNTHRHLAEMRDQLGRIGGVSPELVFTPHLLPVRRGILETIHIPLKRALSAAEAMTVYEGVYGAEPFVEVLPEGAPTLARVVGTNLVSLGAVPAEGISTPLLTVVVAEDNLVKGAAGQAVQNLNVMMGWPETEGLV